MDLKVYYRKIRAIEEQIEEKDVIVISLETPDGGKPGVRSEVPKLLAAKLVVEGKAKLATAEESAEYRAAIREAHDRARDEAMAKKVQITVVPESDLKARRSGQKPSR